MLVGFAVKNYKSFYKESVMSMLAGIGDEYIDINTFTGNGKNILKTAFVFGANSAGKSNFLEAFKYMKFRVTYSFQMKQNNDRNIHYFFNNQGQHLPTTFIAEFILNSESYTYEFSEYHGDIVYEKLIRKKLRESVLFERRSPEYQSITMIDEVKKQFSKYLHSVRKDSLIISTMAHLNNKLAQQIYQWFDDIIFFNENNISSQDIASLKKIDPNYLAYVKMADQTFIDIDSIEEEIDETVFEMVIEIANTMKKFDKNLEDISNTHVQLQSIHHIYDENYSVIRDERVYLKEFSSKGTQKFISLLFPILTAIKDGRIIVIDEIESNLHVALVKVIVSLFHSIDINHANAQLIASTHDIFLLDEDLRRDQIYFAEKNIYGESELFSLSDIDGIKKNDPYIKKYLSGVYGAIPSIKNYHGQ